MAEQLHGSLDWDSDLHQGTVPFFAEGGRASGAEAQSDGDVEAELAELALEEGLPDVDSDSPDPWDEAEPPAYDPRAAKLELLRTLLPNPNTAISTFGERSVRDERVALNRVKSEVRGLAQARAAALESAAHTRRAQLTAEERLHLLGRELDELLDARDAGANDPELWSLVEGAQSLFDAQAASHTRATDTANAAQLEADKLSRMLSDATRQQAALAGERAQQICKLLHLAYSFRQLADWIQLAYSWLTV